MIYLVPIFALMLGLTLSAAMPTRGGRAVALTVAFLGLTLMVMVSVVESYGLPKPYWFEFRDLNKGQVVAAVPVENKAIYVWITAAGSSVPRSYVLPWSQKGAQELQDAMNKAEADGSSVEMGAAGDGADAGEPMFYAPPVPAQPPKNYAPPPAAMEFHSPAYQPHP